MNLIEYLANEMYDDCGSSGTSIEKLNDAVAIALFGKRKSEALQSTTAEEISAFLLEPVPAPKNLHRAIITSGLPEDQFVGLLSNAIMELAFGLMSRQASQKDWDIEIYNELPSAYPFLVRAKHTKKAKSYATGIFQVRSLVHLFAAIDEEDDPTQFECTPLHDGGVFFTITEDKDGPDTIFSADGEVAISNNLLGHLIEMHDKKKPWFDLSFVQEAFGFECVSRQAAEA